MADIASPIAICLAGGITAACVQSLAPDLASWGVSGPSILWGGVGAYAGDVLRLLQAQDAGRAYTRMTRGMLFVSGAVGAVGGPWAAQVAAGGGLLATCGCSVIVGATWHWLLQQVLQRVINRIGGAAPRDTGATQ